MEDRARDVLGWLGLDRHDIPYYLHPLNLKWSEAGAAHDLARFRSVAERLQADPAYWSALLRDVNWRCTLVGCVCLLVRRSAGFFGDLAFRFRAGNMVTPQIAVTAGLLYPEDAAPFLTAFLEEPEAMHRPREFVSAEEVLARLGKRPAAPAARASRWPSWLDADDALLAEQVVRRQWEFWSQPALRAGLTRPRAAPA